MMMSPQVFLCPGISPRLPMFDIEQIRSDLEEFTRLVDEEYYLNGAGLKDKAEFSKIYEKFGHLFNQDIISYVQEYSKTAKGEEARRVKYLRAFLVGDYLENRVKELSDKFLTMESEATIKVRGETIPFRQSAVTMVNEEIREKREDIFRARNIVVENLNPVLKERTILLHHTARELGFEDYAALYEEIKGVELQPLCLAVQKFLDKTRPLYEKKMSELIESRVGVSLPEAEKHDVSFAFRATEFDKFFRKEDAVETLTRTLAGMGINLRDQKNIHLDVEERPKKNPRAFVSPVKVPEDIRLVVMPQGGHDDYASLFHEAGHAEHFGSTRADLPVEYKYLGDNSLTEGFAFLMEYLVTSKQWLEEFTRMEDPKRFLDFVYLYKLYFLRRYAAKLSYELDLHKKGLQAAPSNYKTRLEATLIFKHPPAHYLIDVDDGFYAADYLRAWIFEAQLKRILVQHYGENWFEKKAAGIQLQNWWSLGQKYRVEEMLKNIGYNGLDLRLLTEEIVSNLR